MWMYHGIEDNSMPEKKMISLMQENRHLTSFGYPSVTFMFKFIILWYTTDNSMNNIIAS